MKGYVPREPRNKTVCIAFLKVRPPKGRHGKAQEDGRGSHQGL